MQGWALHAAYGERPGSLAERLALLHGSAYPRDGQAGRILVQTMANRSRRRLMRAYFGLGFATSAILGCAALLLMLFVDPENARIQGPWVSEASASLPLAWRKEPLPRRAEIAHPAPVVVAAAPSSLPPQPIDMPILRTERALAPFPLHLARADLADPDVRVVLRDVPEAALLSTGTRENAHTWVLRPGDLGDLYLTLGDEAPESFNVKIVVARIAGIASKPLVAHVRLVNGAEDEPMLPPSMRGTQTASGDTDAVDAPARPARRLKTAVQAVRHAPPLAPWPASLQVASARPVAAPAEAVAVAPQPALSAPPVSRPEGMSALGALPHEDDAGRRVWWKMPIGSWLPLPGTPNPL